VREKKKGGENTLAVRFENIPKGTKERLPLEKWDIRKAAIEMGGTDRDTAYFTVPGETTRKKAACVTIPVNSLREPLQKRILNGNWF
jgi:hypothetical protein